MKKLSLMAILIMATLFACNKKDEQEKENNANFNDNELNFKTNTSQLSDISDILGIHEFDKGTVIDNSTFQFNIKAVPVDVNLHDIDLNNTVVNLEKVNEDHYKISCELQSIGFAELEINKISNEMTFVINGEKTNLYTGVIISTENQLAVIILMDLLSEVIQKDLLKKNRKIINSTLRNRPVYAHTVNFGATKVESVDRAKSNQVSAEVLKPAGCVVVGTSTSCLWGEFGCITVTTYKCS